MDYTHNYAGFEQLLSSGIGRGLLLDVLGDALLLVAHDGLNTEDYEKPTMLKLEALVRLMRAIYQLEPEADGD